MYHGTIDLLSVQKINEAMNDNLLSPYLLLNNIRLTLNIDILSTNEAFAIIRSCNIDVPSFSQTLTSTVNP